MTLGGLAGAGIAFLFGGEMEEWVAGGVGLGAVLPFLFSPLIAASRTDTEPRSRSKKRNLVPLFWGLVVTALLAFVGYTGWRYSQVGELKAYCESIALEMMEEQRSTGVLPDSMLAVEIPQVDVPEIGLDWQGPFFGRHADMYSLSFKCEDKIYFMHPPFKRRLGWRYYTMEFNVHPGYISSSWDDNPTAKPR